MVDAVWTHFGNQAKACRAMGSPFTARLADLAPHYIDSTTRTGRRILEWPGDPAHDALSLRLFGGLHSLALSRTIPGLNAVYPPGAVTDATLLAALRRTLEEHDTFLHDYLESPPQTNEVARSALLLPGFLWLARRFNRPVDLIEPGASAGLNLFFDHYACHHGTAQWGNPVRAPLALAPEIYGVPPSLEGDLRIIRRRACDQSPLDPANPGHRTRLMSYIWADQTHRLERLNSALTFAASQPERVEEADAGEFVRRCLCEPPQDGGLRVIAHTIFWQYLPEETKAGIMASMQEAANKAPVAWLRLEADGKEPGASLFVTLYPSGETIDLARGDFHGRWIRWLAM